MENTSENSPEMCARFKAAEAVCKAAILRDKLFGVVVNGKATPTNITEWLRASDAYRANIEEWDKLQK